MNRLRLIAAVLVAVGFLASIPHAASAALVDYFVDTKWLADRQSSIRIVDVRVSPLYLLGHIDGAVHIDKKEFLSERNGVKSLVPTVAEFEALLDRYGISPDTTVVAYAEHDNPYAARFIWTLRYHGHDNAYILDGGYEKWSREKRATAILPTKVTPGSGYRVAQAQGIRANAEDVLTRMENSKVAVWDTRTPGEFQGTDVRANRGGHIPGAIHLNWVDLQKEVNGVKVLKSEEEIRAMLKAAGLTPDRQIIAHCQTGIRSSYATLVLLGLGYGNAQNYDGSWIEWANNPGYPVLGQQVAAR
jgi:thiosulfate/3-mercaptopyruvate sulfurtransferase